MKNAIWYLVVIDIIATRTGERRRRQRRIKNQRKALRELNKAVRRLDAECQRLKDTITSISYD